MKQHIVVCIGSGMDAEAVKLLRASGEVVESDPQRFPEVIKNATVLVIGVDVRVDRAIFDHAKDLRVIATPATGIDHIDVEEAGQRGIDVLSLKGETAFLAGITGTAELAFGLLLSLIRKIPSASQSVLDGNWRREDFQGRSLLGKTLGVIGVGRLGSRMAQYGASFGMRVVGYDVAPPSSPPCEMIDVQTLLEQSDVISLHVPLNDDTEGMIGQKEISAMKPGAILINTARGKVVDEAAVLSSLESKHLGGYGTDVLADELQFPDAIKAHPLIGYAKNHDNVLITPHIGGMTAESRAATDVFIAKKVVAFLGSHA